MCGRPIEPCFGFWLSGDFDSLSRNTTRPWTADTLVRQPSPNSMCPNAERFSLEAQHSRDFTNLSRLGYIYSVTSLRLDGVRFVVYPQDHEPRHVHVFVAEEEVIVDLREDGNVAIADRKDAIRPCNAKRSDVRKALILASEYFEELVEMWEAMHEE